MSNRFIFEQAPGHLIRRAHQISVAVFADEVGAHAVTPVQFAILNLLLGQPGIDQITLAQGVAFDAATIGSVIGRLEKKGYLSKAKDPLDQRKSHLNLLRKADPLLKKIDAMRKDYFASLFEDFSPEEIALFKSRGRSLVRVMIATFLDPSIGLPKDIDLGCGRNGNSSSLCFSKA